MSHKNKMNLTQAIFPGLTITAGILQLLIAFSQLYIYQKSGYKRAKTVMWFTFFSAPFAFHQFVIQSRFFSDNFSIFLCVFIFSLICIPRYFYFKSMSFFIAIPDNKYKSYMISNFTIGFFTIFPMLFYVTGGPELLFNTSVKISTGNYFTDSFAMILGEPVLYGVVVLSLYAALDIYYGNFLLQRLRRSSRDRWLMIGVVVTMCAALFENFLLPVTISFYVPIYIFSNLFETIRMSFLSVKEFVIESELKGSQLQPVSVPQNISVSYQNSNLTDDKVRELSEKTRALLEELRLYQNSNLRLDKLAHHVGVPSYMLSQVINNGMNTTFSDLVNSYRIDEIKEKLRDNENVSKNITEIAYDSGFNSKSTFFTAFKKASGQTPAEYRKSVSHNPHSENLASL